MANENDTFRDLVAASEHLKQRWNQTVEHMTTQARTLLGVELTPADIVTLPAARIHVLSSGDALDPIWLEEVLRVPAAMKAKADRDLKAALESGEESALDELSRMPRAERLSKARSLGMTDTKNAAPTSVADQATLLRRLLTLSPQQRISKGREWGLIK
ncbi:MAG: hypothetical protein ACOH2M_19315 [Cypionkella sp.]